MQATTPWACRRRAAPPATASKCGSQHHHRCLPKARGATSALKREVAILTQVPNGLLVLEPAKMRSLKARIAFAFKIAAAILAVAIGGAFAAVQIGIFHQGHWLTMTSSCVSFVGGQSSVRMETSFGVQAIQIPTRALSAIWCNDNKTAYFLDVVFVGPPARFVTTFEIDFYYSRRRKDPHYGPLNWLSIRSAGNAYAGNWCTDNYRKAAPYEYGADVVFATRDRSFLYIFPSDMAPQTEGNIVGCSYLARCQVDGPRLGQSCTVAFVESGMGVDFHIPDTEIARVTEHIADARTFFRETFAKPSQRP